MSNKPLNILFLCTGNSARSIMAEALTNHYAEGRNIKAWSAGSDPQQAVNQYVLEHLQKSKIDTSNLHSKNWDRFFDNDSLQMDVVITVCDQAAETCPAIPGQPATAHWGFEDPAPIEDADAQSKKVRDIFFGLQKRIQILLALPDEKLDRLRIRRDAFESQLADIHKEA